MCFNEGPGGPKGILQKEYLIAELVHEVNRIFCETQGDFSQKPWRDSPDWQRKSAINGVYHVVNNPDTTPEESHINWLKEKELDGWKYGKVKDVEKKEHPCFVPYFALPEEQKAKDKFFTTIVKFCLQNFETKGNQENV